MRHAKPTSGLGSEVGLIPRAVLVSVVAAVLAMAVILLLVFSDHLPRFAGAVIALAIGVPALCVDVTAAAHALRAHHVSGS